MLERIVLVVCESGPYKHVQDLLEQGVGWIPWGYRASQLGEDVRDRIRSGDVVELWRVDDVRAPLTAQPLTVAQIDYMVRTPDYLALTLRRIPNQDAELSQAAAVLEGVKGGFLAFKVGPP